MAFKLLKCLPSPSSLCSGSNDDLLRNEAGGQGIVHTSSDDTQGRQGDSSSDGEQQQQQQRLRLEKVSEVSENTEDDSEKSILDPVLANSSSASLSRSGSGKNEDATLGDHGSNTNSSKGGAVPSGAASSVGLSRKDSFHQWSSDEETNIMMSRMRAFFRGMLVRRPSAEQQPAVVRQPPPQLALFEQELTRLMKTVPGIRDDQVREIVEYLSSEETWSDSYDSSDYTDYTSSDLEGGAGVGGGASFFADKHATDVEGGPGVGFPDLEDVHVLEDQVSAISRLGEGVSAATAAAAANTVDPDAEDFQKETALMYQKLMNSVVARMQFNSSGTTSGDVAPPGEGAANHLSSPPMAAKILHHISSRLVTLMHEVSAVSSDNSSLASMSDSRQSLYSGRHRLSPLTTSSPKITGERHSGRRQQKLHRLDVESPSRRRNQLLNSSLEEEEEKEEEEANSAGYTFASLDSPKVLIGPNLGGSGAGGSPQTGSGAGSSGGNPFRFTKNSSKSVEILDLGRRRASLDDKSLKLASIAKSTSTEYDVWQGVHRAMEGGSGSGAGRRGSLPRGQLVDHLAAHSSSSGMAQKSFLV